jgi:hypothetical protein
MGRHGVYYRAALPTGGRVSARGPSESQVVPPSAADGLQEIDSAAASEMMDSTAAALLAEFEEKRRRIRLFPFAVLLTLLLAFMTASAGSSLLFLAVIVAGAVVSWFAWNRDAVAKAVVLLYQLEDDAEAGYQQLHDAFDDLCRCGRLWHVEAKGDVNDWNGTLAPEP